VLHLKRYLLHSKRKAGRLQEGRPKRDREGPILADQGVTRQGVDAEDWEGPGFQACVDAANVSRKFPLESKRRRLLLSFNHHAEVASLPPDEADALLDWCEETPKPRLTRELRGEVHRRRAKRRDVAPSVAPRISGLMFWLGSFA
jgi:hypothetical protein